MVVLTVMSQAALTTAWSALDDFSGQSSPRLLAGMEICGRFESVVALYGASTSPTTRPSQRFTSGTHDVNLHGLKGSCWRKCRTRAVTAVNHSVVCSAEVCIADSCICSYVYWNCSIDM